MKKITKCFFSFLTVFNLFSCSKSSNVIVPEVAACSLQIGVVMSASGIDFDYNKLVWDGVKQYANSVNMSSSCYQYLEASIDDESYVEYLRSFADKMDIVIAASPEMKDDILSVANEYKSTTFLLIDEAVEAINVVSLNYDEKFKAFLAGVLAANYALKRGNAKIAYYGDNTKYQAIFEQGVTKLNRNLEVEFASDLEHDFTDISIVYYESSEIETINNGDIGSIEIRANKLNDLISRNIPEDVFNILKAKERKKLVIGQYNSRDFIIDDAEFSLFVAECKKIVSNPAFEYATIPSYLIVVEDDTEGCASSESDACDVEELNNNQETKNE